MTTRAMRRHHAQRLKREAAARLKADGTTATPRRVGIHADHPCRCSCPMCGNPRRKQRGKNRQTVRERQVDNDLNQKD